MTAKKLFDLMVSHRECFSKIEALNLAERRTVVELATLELLTWHIKGFSGKEKQLFADVLRNRCNNFAKFTRKHLCWSHFLINLQIFTENLGETASGTHQMYQEKWHEQLFWKMNITKHWLYWKNTLFSQL